MVTAINWPTLRPAVLGTGGGGGAGGGGGEGGQQVADLIGLRMGGAGLRASLRWFQSLGRMGPIGAQHTSLFIVIPRTHRDGGVSPPPGCDEPRDQLVADDVEVARGSQCDEERADVVT